MGKEVKIGLAVIGVLLCVFGGVLFVRLRREQPISAPAKVAAAKKDGKLKAADKTDGKPAKAREDRYAQRASPAKPSTPRDNKPPAGPADAISLEAPPLNSSPYRKLPTGDRYGRFADAPTGQSSEVGEVSAEGTDAAEADAAMPQDRFAQGSGVGVAFSESDEAESGLDEPADETEADDPTVQIAPLNDDSDDELNVRPAANDRYADRRREDYTVGERSARVAEETQDETDSLETDAADEAPRPLGRFDGNSDTVYTVEPNDNFWRISQKVYGTGAYFKALEEHNRQQYGDRPLINAGDAVAVPPLATLREKYPELCPKPREAPVDRGGAGLASSPARGRPTQRSYTVVEGDTLFDIARHELGKASRWAEIYRINRDQLGEDFYYLSPGMQLVLPAGGEKIDPVAARPAPRDNDHR